MHLTSRTGIFAVKFMSDLPEFEHLDLQQCRGFGFTSDNLEMVRQLPLSLIIYFYGVKVLPRLRAWLGDRIDLSLPKIQPDTCNVVLHFLWSVVFRIVDVILKFASDKLGNSAKQTVSTMDTASKNWIEIIKDVFGYIESSFHLLGMILISVSSWRIFVAYFIAFIWFKETNMLRELWDLAILKIFEGSKSTAIDIAQSTGRHLFRHQLAARASYWEKPDGGYDLDKIKDYFSGGKESHGLSREVKKQLFGEDVQKTKNKAKREGEKAQANIFSFVAMKGKDDGKNLGSETIYNTFVDYRSKLGEVAEKKTATEAVNSSINLIDETFNKSDIKQSSGQIRAWEYMLQFDWPKIWLFVSWIYLIPKDWCRHWVSSKKARNPSLINTLFGFFTIALFASLIPDEMRRLNTSFIMIMMALGLSGYLQPAMFILIGALACVAVSFHSSFKTKIDLVYKGKVCHLSHSHLTVLLKPEKLFQMFGNFKDCNFGDEIDFGTFNDNYEFEVDINNLPWPKDTTLQNSGFERDGAIHIRPKYVVYKLNENSEGQQPSLEIVETKVSNALYADESLKQIGANNQKKYSLVLVTLNGGDVRSRKLFNYELPSKLERQVLERGGMAHVFAVHEDKIQRLIHVKEWDAVSQTTTEGDSVPSEHVKSLDLKDSVIVVPGETDPVELTYFTPDIDKYNISGDLTDNQIKYLTFLILCYQKIKTPAKKTSKNPQDDRNQWDNILKEIVPHLAGSSPKCARATPEGCFETLLELDSGAVAWDYSNAVKDREGNALQPAAIVQALVDIKNRRRLVQYEDNVVDLVGIRMFHTARSNIEQKYLAGLKDKDPEWPEVKLKDPTKLKFDRASDLKEVWVANDAKHVSSEWIQLFVRNSDTLLDLWKSIPQEIKVNAADAKWSFHATDQKGPAHVDCTEGNDKLPNGNLLVITWRDPKDDKAISSFITETFKGLKQ